MESSKDKVQQLFDWAISNGIKFPKMEIRTYSPNFRGVHAKDTIHTGEAIVSVPINMILTETIGYTKSPLGAKIKASGVKILFPYCTYLACLLNDASKDPKHFIRPYFDMFPTDAKTYPICYNDDDLNDLKELSIYSIFCIPHNT